MSTHQLPSAGTNLAVLVGTLSRDAELRTLPSGDDVLALELTVRPTEGPAESVPGRLVRRPAVGGRAGPPARSCSSSAGCAGASSGPAAPPRAAPRSWPTAVVPTRPGGAAARR